MRIKLKDYCVLFVLLLVTLGIGGFVIAGINYSKEEFWNDVSIESYIAVPALSASTTNGGTYTNLCTNYYRLCATNRRGRVPIGTNIILTITGGTNTNAAAFVWERVGGIRSMIVERSTNVGVDWVHLALAANVTNWFDYGTNSWTSGSVTSLYSVIPTPVVPWTNTFYVWDYTVWTARSSLVPDGDANTNFGDDCGVLCGLYNYMASNTTQSVVCGGEGNTIEPDSFYGFIGGGSNNTYEEDNTAGVIGGGEANSLDGSHSVIGGGLGNTNSGASSVIGGGVNNELSGEYGFIGGGHTNTVESDYGTVTGGRSNSILGTAHYSFIGGGFGNKIDTKDDYSVLVGGALNNFSDEYDCMALLGGTSNVLFGDWATLVGGANNTNSGKYGFLGAGATNRVGGQGAVIPGGAFNVANGDYSYAAGRNAKATNHHSYVWNDGSSDYGSHGTNTFNAQSIGGAFFNTAGAGLHVDEVQVPTNCFAGSYVEGWATNGSLTLTLQTNYYTWTNWIQGSYTPAGIGWTNNGVIITNDCAAGMYVIIGSLGYSMNANTENLHGHIFMSDDGGATNKLNNLGNSCYNQTSDKTYTLGISGFVRLDLDDYLELRFQNDDSAGKVVTAQHMSFSAYKIGN